MVSHQVSKVDEQIKILFERNYYKHFDIRVVRKKTSRRTFRKTSESSKNERDSLLQVRGNAWRVISGKVYFIIIHGIC